MLPYRLPSIQRSRHIAYVQPHWITVDTRTGIFQRSTDASKIAVTRDPFHCSWNKYLARQGQHLRLWNTSSFDTI